jgi:methylated-DNA-[protein]-cysteine S-methyltransferase
MERYAFVPAPFGSVGLMAGQRGLRQLVFFTSPVEPADAPGAGELWPGCPRSELVWDQALLPDLQQQLIDYFEGQPVRFQAPLDLTCLTVFQRRVLTACSRLDYGETTTYGELARRIGQPRAARAVGGALARNPIPIVIPCHRVLAGDGSLGGFTSEMGVDLKRDLLALEVAGSGRPHGWCDFRCVAGGVPLQISG